MNLYRQSRGNVASRWNAFRWLVCLVAFIPLAALNATSHRADGDWPMWRYDSARSAASPDSLPNELQLLWRRTGTPRVQAWDDPLNLDLMSYDRLFEPIVIDGRMFVGHSDSDKLSAVDLETGRDLWAFYTDAPVRLAPVGWQGRVYFTSDDGRLYCVDAVTGDLVWQFSGGPGPRKVIGNRRLVSAWPARGGPVVKDGKIYFAASIWPMMGVFIYALDADTGEIEWVNDSSGSTYIKQPHSADAFAGVAPQGALVATAEHLIIPGGRSVPAVLDRATGTLRYFELNAGGKGTGGSFVIADESVFFVHTRGKGTREFNLASGDKTAFMPNQPVLHGDRVYSAETTQDGKPVVRAYDSGRKIVWETDVDGTGDLILAGDRLYAAGKDSLSAIELPEIRSGSAASSPRVAWSIPVEDQIERLLASDGKLFAVTLGGDILAFGADQPSSAPHLPEEAHSLTVSPDAERRVRQLLKNGNADGYALWFGAADEALLNAMAIQSPFVQLAIVDADAQRVRRFRQRLDRAGLYGRVTVHQGTPTSFAASPYLAEMIFVGEELALELAADVDALSALYESVRPYGGVLQLLTSRDSAEGVLSGSREPGLEQARVEPRDDVVLLHREGALPGSADWTHLHGDIANTRKSNDSLVKLPLGVLWFGGSSHMDVLPRHGHGPPQQVVDGRLFIQGINVLSARDVYTGRVLWKREFQDLGTFDVYYDSTYKETPLDPAYNQVHIPGANARGTNFVVTPEHVYIVEGSLCRVLDPATGESIRDIALPQDDPENPHDWSYIGVYGDVLIGGLGFARYRDRLGLSFDDEDSQLRSSKAGYGSKSLDRAGSLALVAFDRHTGQLLWRVDAKHSFWNNAVVAGGGRIYALDKHPKPVEDKLRRRGRALPDSYRLVALDAKTGDTVWQQEQGVFGTWLGYSETHDLLLQAGAAGSDRLSAEVDRGMTVHRGKDGSVKWSQPDFKYSGPCILHNDLIITNANSYSESAGALYLTTGKPYLITNPLTQQQEPWRITRTYGCNTILASENLLTFRSGAAGFYDLATHGGTGNFGGFKSGCTGNLIAAGGVLNAPDYTRTCSCSYQNQTSLALVHMPDIETWTINHMARLDGEGRAIDRLGVNFGAPGHRVSQDSILWIESPTVAAEQTALRIETVGDFRVIRRHSSAIEAEDYRWVFASGLEGEGEIRIALRGVADKGGEGASQSKPSSGDPPPPQRYRIRLFFGLPRGGGAAIGPRTFDVHVNDVAVVTDLTLVEGQSEIRDCEPIELGELLTLRLVAERGTPILSGIELSRINR